MVAELEQLDACAQKNIDAFNDLSSDAEEGGADLLLAAVECFSAAGRSAKSVKVLKHLQKKFPEVAEANDARYRIRQHYRTLVHERLDAQRLAGQACGASPFDPPPEASAEALVSIAECLEEGAMFGVPLRYRRLAAERGAGPANAEQLEKLEETVESLRQAMLDL